MELIYPDKKTEKEILNFISNSQFSIPFKNNNSLINGNNREVLSLLLHKYNMAGKIDLIYIDPPFATNGTFTIGEERTSTISGSREDAIAYTDTLLGEEFLEFLRERLILARELLSDKGSIYLHIDYKIGHYVKIIMDEIFGIKNFKNDITRIKCNPKNFSRKAYGNIKDLILFYSKTDTPIWNEPFMQYSEEDIAKLYKKIKDYTKYAHNILDLYCGTGTIGIFLSQIATSVVGIEVVEDAVIAAKSNADINNVENIKFICGRVEDYIDGFNNIDLIIVDPPRSGLDKKTIDNVKRINPKEIIYVSCDPMTLVRDLKELEEDYLIKEITPVDMFSNTHHVECVCVLKLK